MGDDARPHEPARRARDAAHASVNAVETHSPPSYVGAPLEGKFELKPFHVEVVSVTFYPGARKECNVHVRIADRETGQIQNLYARETFPLDYPDAVCAREILIAFMRHEVEECIHVNGVRVWDPHVGRPGGI